MRVVVTGASGFLGSAVLEKLKASGVDALGVSRQQIPGLVHVSDYSAAPDGDVLIHLAETNDRAWVNKNGHFFEKSAENLIHALTKKGFKKIIYASSAAVYGDQVVEPRRTDEHVHIIDSYSRIKLHSEQVVLGHNGVVARLTNLYGPGMSKMNVLSAILSQLKQPDSIQLHDVNPVRDFLWIDDAATALLKMVSNNSTGIFNVGSGIGVKIYELAKLALFFSGQPDKYIISVQQEKKISTLIADISKTTETFCWRPEMKLEDGIEHLVTLGMGFL